AVDMALPEAAIVEIGLERQSVAWFPASAARHEGEFVLGGLRDRVDAGPIPVEQLDRRCGGSAEAVVGPGKGHMELGLLAAGADVGINAAQPRWRILAPA